MSSVVGVPGHFEFLSKAQFDQIRLLHANDPKLKVRKMWQLASKKALRKTEDERRPSWAQRFKNIEPMNALRLRYNANKSIWVEDEIQVKIEAGFRTNLIIQYDSYSYGFVPSDSNIEIP